ncbi:TetR/AcrR family transcriptional regulator [Nocardioides sp. SOB77]|uniref:TetR/AcrR family transcriptional regulator n=1 Tax=Nocardioides oceani TaxID=3058369 RepID=A0ABT8FM13_9ACTN|nr:TetR/AcrR family transcriptional regulator [Nocardioides oceani]MDN4175555.1 TetR/AcrR family transcriptional regulator [Nocardioides oceani]
MPRIQAATVAEHREQQRRALLDAARAILGETGRAPSVGAVAARAGLARTSVYQYFPSAEELLAAVVADVFPHWARQVLDRVAAASSPGERVWAYVQANVALFASSEQAVAGALTKVVEPHVLQGPMREFHARLQGPLLSALEDLGEPEPAEMAEHVDSLVHQASRPFGDLDAADRPAAEAVALARLRRLLGGYLQLDARPSD